MIGRIGMFALCLAVVGGAGMAETPPPPRGAAPEVAPPAARGAEKEAPTRPAERVAEPEGYRGEPYQAPVPPTLAGAEVIGDEVAHALWWSGRVPFVDVLPVPPRPDGLPEGTIWRDPPHESIPGAVWLANTGYDGLDAATLGYFLAGLERVTGGDRAAPVVIFCKRDCWMSWNAGKRAMENGYSRVFWYPGGSDGWAEAGWALERAEPWKP